jgi:transcriptional regulator with GAF, ATPase, and Fis domain
MHSAGDGSITMAFPGESPSGRHSISEDAVNFSAIARAFFSAGSVPATLASVVELAASTVEGCDYAGLFLIEGNVISTPAFTDPMVVEIDDLQLQTGQGPCLDAVSHRLTFYSTDLARDLRWLHFAPRALDLGIHSILALPLDSGSPQGCLSLSAHDPAAFDVIGRAQASFLAALAGIALSVARSHRNEEERVESLRAALITRETLGEAAGILMERDKISAPRALQILRKASQRLNLNLGEVAQNMIDTVDLPAAAGGDRGTGRTGRADGFGRTGSFNPGPGRHRSRAE